MLACGDICWRNLVEPGGPSTVLQRPSRSSELSQTSSFHQRMFGGMLALATVDA